MWLEALESNVQGTLGLPMGEKGAMIGKAAEDAEVEEDPDLEESIIC